MILWLLACAEREAPDACVTDAEFLQSAAETLSDCWTCHQAGGLAGATRYVLEDPSSPASTDKNLEMFQALLGALGSEAFLAKPTGNGHQGGQRVQPYSEGYAVLAELAARAQDPGGCDFPGEKPPLCGDGVPRPGSAPLQRLTALQLVNSIDALIGVRLDPALYPQTTTGNFRSFASLNTVSEAGVEQFLLAAEAASASLRLPEDLGCAQDEAEADCARRWSLDFARRAYRRPLTGQEEKLATRFLDAGLDVDTAVRMQVELILQSPAFLYLDAMPLGEADPSRLEPYSVAARLSYFLTDAPPDDQLLASVEAGEFSTRAQVSAHAQRLAQSPAALGSVAAFHEDWLHLWRLEDISRDSAIYPYFSEQLLADIRTESDLFVTEVVWTGNPTFQTLLFGTQSWVTPELADLYGVDAPAQAWGLADLGADRTGILTRSAWLSAHAYTTDSAPVRRGAWVLQVMFCEDLSPPADVNMNLPETSEALPTIRERLAQHTSDPVCASCHQRIDPIGLSFEHMGALGEWRDQWDDGHPVDASASLSDPRGEVYGAAELVTLLSTSPKLQSCYAQRVFEYGIRRAAETEDACTLAELTQRFEASDGNLHQLWVDVAMTDAFLYRHPLERP